MKNREMCSLQKDAVGLAEPYPLEAAGVRIKRRQNFQWIEALGSTGYLG